ncbi:hypothetical protein [Microcoleus vaginatus]
MKSGILGAIPYGIAALHAFLAAGVCAVAGDRFNQTGSVTN